MICSSHLIVRADASGSIGVGHILRCLAIAQCWIEHFGTVEFVVRHCPDSLANRLESEKIQLSKLPHDLPSETEGKYLCDVIKSQNASWVVLDGYMFDEKYQLSIAESGARMLVIDDNGENVKYASDFVLNPNIHASEAMYAHRSPKTHLFLGCRYFLARQEFRLATSLARNCSDDDRPLRVLITLGGADPGDMTSKVLDILLSLTSIELEIHVIVGCANVHRKAVADRVAHIENVGIVEFQDDVSQVFRWADAAITSASTSCFEFLMLGVPVIACHYAENQKLLYQHLIGQDLCLGIGSARDLAEKNTRVLIETYLGDKKGRSLRVSAGKKLLDGRGAQRIVAQMRATDIKLRPADQKDMELLWAWANDSRTRAMSFDKDSISLESHKTWFSNKLSTLGTRIYLGSVGDLIDFGQIRFDVTKEGYAEVDLSIAPEFRGKRLASTLIIQGTKRYLSESEVTEVSAYILPENQASIAAFSVAGYHLQDTRMMDGREVVCMTARTP